MKLHQNVGEDKPGKSGKSLKSNITDNNSAKMNTSRGVIHGYDGVALVDGKHQAVVHAEAFGAAQEHDLLIPVIGGTRENFRSIGKKSDVFEGTKLILEQIYPSRETKSKHPVVALLCGAQSI